MATYYLQQVLSSFAAPNITESTAAPAQSSAAPAPSDLFTFLWSFTALRDWLKLAVLGGFFETCRRLFSFFYGKVQDAFFINASFTDEDMSYEWMMAWLAKQPSWHDCRDVEISTDAGSASTAVVLDGPENGPTSYMKSSRKLAYLPSFSRTYSLWYKRRWVTITRTQEQVTYYNKQQTLHLRIMSRSKRILIELLQEARNEYLAAQEHSVCIYISDINQNWRHTACRAKRALNSVVLDPGIKELLLDDARDFLDSKPWYAERGIPFRRGYLLYGAPGSGKTSLIHCLAGELGLDVYVISLSRAGMDDAALDSLVNDLPERCIALMEDIDAAFTHGLNRDKTRDSSSDPEQPKEASSNSPTSRLSLSGLLNALDGVSAQEGRILIATTNKYTSLDPALCRPGRMDLHIEFNLASRYQARELFARFYLPSPTEEKKEDEETDSGYGSSTSDTPESMTPVEEEKPKENAPVVHGAVHRRRAPKLSRRQVRELADQFADAIPERELSMASLQGYLMMYKVRPFEAVKDAETWVEKERQERLKKEQAAKEKEEKEKKEREEKEKKEKEEKEKEEKEKKEKEEKEKKEKEKEKKEKEEEEKEKEEKEKSTKENKSDEKKE